MCLFVRTYICSKDYYAFLEEETGTAVGKGKGNANSRRK